MMAPQLCEHIKTHRIEKRVNIIECELYLNYAVKKYIVKKFDQCNSQQQRKK